MTNINSAFYNYDETVEKSKTSYSGLLGLAINGNRIVNHPTRAGYVYVRLRDNLSEVVQAFNDKVSPVYDFPVLIQRKGNRWYVLGRDDLRYESWGTSAPYLPRHGDQHSFNRDGGGGGDVTWVYPDQFMPLLVYPSGTYGASNLLVAHYVLQKADKFIYVGNTGTANIVRYKPTNSNAIVGLVYLDRDTGNPGFLINSGTPFAGTITGTTAILPYLPYPSATQEPLYAFRLVSGTTSLTWSNLYNVRQFIGGSTSTGTSSGVSDHESLTGLLGGSANNHYHLTPSQVIGLVSGTNTQLHSHSGTPVDYNFVTGSIAFADSAGFLIEDNKHLRYNQTLRSIRMGKDFPFINYADQFPIFITAEYPGESPVIGTRSWGTGTSGLPFSGFAGYRSRGTIENPTAIKQDDLITSFFGQGYDGGDFWTSSRIRTYANQDWVTGTYRGSRMEFWTIPDNSPTIEKTLVIGEGGLASNVTANKTLTLTATDNFTLTVPQSMVSAGRDVANTFTAAQTISNTTDVSGAGTGALIVSGGAAIAKLLIVGSNGAGGQMYFNGGAGFVRDLIFATDFSSRWIIRTDSTAESGSNAGSDFLLQARTDAGGNLGNVFTITRSTRQFNFSHTTDSTSPTTGVVIVGGGVGIAKALYVGTSILSVSPTAGIGYATGGGGTVTQATSKATGVTLNRVTGLITMNNAALAADTTVTFTLTNSAIAATDTIILNHASAGTAGAYTLNAQVAAGSATINVRNVTAGSLSEAIVIRYTVIKSVSA